MRGGDGGCEPGRLSTRRARRTNFGRLELLLPRPGVAHFPSPSSSSSLSASPEEGGGDSCDQKGRRIIMAPTYLDRVVSEIIETERTYVRDLRMIVEDYLAHIIDRADPSVRPEQVCFLFGNIEDIYEFNSELLQDLDLCRRDAVAVARCFVTKSEYFDIYTQYCTNYPNSVAALTDCMQDKSLAVFFRERQAALKRPLPLGSYLLKPVQRILKYHLLLQEIAKHFDPQEEGYEVVEEAIVTMTSVAWYINDMKRKHEHAVRLQEVQSLLLHWKGPDLTTYGELVLEGTFKVHRAKNERTLFLLERVLLITKRRGEHYVYKEHISCSALMLIEITKDSLSFSVTHYKQPKRPHTVQAKSVEEKKMWAQHIKRIILENHHDIIPQKAKDTILNPRYPTGHRYCPERLKKVPCCSPDEFPRQRSADANERIESSAKGQVGAVAKEMERSDVSFNDSNEESGLGEEEEPVGPEAACEQLSTEEEALGSLLPPESCPLSERAGSEDLKPAQVPVCAEDPLSATPESESKPGSSGESSEDEDGEKEADGNGSILPSSVLDKAGTIAEHFSSVKRGAPGQDDVCSPGASPRLPVATRGHLGFSAKHAGPGPSSPLNSVGSDLSEADRMLLSPRGDARFDEDSGVLRRRDSTLSSQDQLLIGKIKMYYEKAENQEAGFGLRRRESLTYIPAGLVKTSVSRLNSIPAQTEPLPPAVDSSSLPSDSKGRMVSSDSLDGQRSAGLQNSGLLVKGFSRSRAQRQQNAEDEDFRPSSEMLKVWQAMEKQLGRTICLSDVTNKRLQKEGAELDLDSISRETVAASSLRDKGNNRTRTASLTVPPGVLRAQLPQGAQLGTHTVDEDEKLTDDKADSKVRYLARQYSQSLKSVTPLVRRRSYGSLADKRTLACVLEESPDSGPSPTLPAAAPVDQVPPRSPEPAGVSPGQSRSRSPAGAICAPQSAEGFDWPDVRELRSKYSDGSGSNAASRSSSVPEQMFDVGSSGRSLSDAAPRRPYAAWTSGRLKSHKGLHGAHSLDPWLSGALVRETRGQRAANDTADHVTREKFPRRQLLVTGKLSPEAEPEPAEAIDDDDDDDAYVEIRSPTSREKISILAVMDRCRAYQESDEYKQRSQLAKSPDGDQSQTAGDHLKTAGDHFQTSAATGQHNLVKNLRQKFQKLNS
ncbi:pleckstrin homology domain-containing family G member 3-like isoform X2 [Phyllopteryx taeniolatus]|uniref:pleckstrin homology domain-containing family G member 3-like isoform X2 n=1 Tax=Phyllopteryx taeniolatus TaxID=161469 RepID=UPI002AD58A5D|nr:pleckstrin homology domain-containing family G member 3-like isoform X2 [Phyllopteryx taeniolatus]